MDKKPRINITGSTFLNVGTVVSVPHGWDGDIEGSLNHFANVGQVVVVRDQQFTVPREIAKIALEAYRVGIKETGDTALAIESVAGHHQIREFLRSKGIEVANLGVAVAALIAQIIG